jgi:replicative DNA helicase
VVRQVNEDPNNQDTGLPAAIDGERVILGAILLDNKAYEETEGKLRSEDFSLDANRRIYECIGRLLRKGVSVDLVTLSNELRTSHELDAVGGVSYLSSLTDGLPRRIAIGDWVNVVKDKSLLRQVMTICNSGIGHAQDQFEPALDIINRVVTRLEDAVHSNSQGTELESVAQWLNENDIYAERQPGIMTGIEEYDELTYGLHPGELTVIAARTSMGKTAMACTLSWQVARRGKAVALFLNEQRKKSFMGRMLCGQANVSLKSYFRGQMDWVEKQYIDDARALFMKLPIFWDERSSMSVPGIRAKCARLQREGDLDLIIIDQLSGLNNQGLGIESGMRTDEKIGMKVRAVKAIGMDLGVPVILFHQLNRETTKNEDARPGLQNLKNSGDIEEAADQISFLYRPGYYKPHEADLKDKDEWILAKARDGPTGVAHVTFVPDYCLWRNR